MQEDVASGRVRVTAKDAVADRYVSKVLVKVIGSGNSDFVTGETDLRGIFKADAIRGETTVIARAQANRYAFFRGTRLLAQAAEAPRRRMRRNSKPRRNSPANRCSKTWIATKRNFNNNNETAIATCSATGSVV